MTYRFFTPPKPAGLAARVNGQLREDFPGPLPAYAISAGDVGLWQLSHPAEADPARLVAFGAVTATDHVARALDPAHR